jgi:hypothetical protein
LKMAKKQCMKVCPQKCKRCMMKSKKLPDEI